MSETFYELLGVSADASRDDIEAAYREMVKEVHPDVSDDADASERTKRLNRARRVLTDETERERYDRVGHDTYTGERTDNGDEDRDQSETQSTTESDRARRQDRRHRQRWRERSPGTGPERAGEPTDATGPSRSSEGPKWQSQGETTAAHGGVDSPSARRQAAAGNTNGPNADWSWNGWERSRSWAVREGGAAGGGVHPSRLFPVEQSVMLLASTFLLYPMFVFTVLYTPFPVVARATVAVCTLLMFAYLLSVPEVAVVVYGVWSFLVPVGLFLMPGIGVFSLAGVVGLSVTWLPFGLSVLTYSVLRH